MTASALPERIQRALSGHFTDAPGRRAPTVVSVEPLFGGACQEHVRVCLRAAEGGPWSGQRVFVLRSDAERSLPGSLSRRQEFPVVARAHAAGVCTPAVHWLCEDLLAPGRASYFMDWADGDTIARRVLRAPQLADARPRLLPQLAQQLARIHAIVPDPADPELTRALGDGLTDPVDTALAGHLRALDQLPEAHPAIELALCFLDENRPTRVENTLCHGDFRTGNFAVSKDGLSAILDWEFAHFGDPMDDLGWACVRDWRFGHLDRPAFGLADRPALFSAYRAASGREVDGARVRYWELMGNVRWAIGALHQGQRYREAAAANRHQELDLELIAIGKRALEIEYEIVRLLDTWE